MKIIFFGTSSVALPILNKLNAEHEILAVVTSPDAPVGRKQLLTPSPAAELAEKLNIKTLKPEKVKSDEEILKDLRQLNADIFIVVSYGKILPKEILDMPPLKTLNVHFSLLPKYRGAAPIQAAIKNGETKSGTTIFLLDELLDHGPILIQKEIAIEPDDTTPILMEKMANISADLLLETLPKYEKGEIIPQEQDHEKASKAPIINKINGKLDFTNTAEMCYNTYRAYQPWPGVYTILPAEASAKAGFQDKILKIIELSIIPDKQALERDPESLLNSKRAEASTMGVSSKDPVSRHGMTSTGTILPGGIVACGQNTYLQLLQVQLEGGKILNIKDFINGHKDFVGLILGKEI